MKVLVLTADYPNIEGGIALAYVHTRNIFYKSSGVDVVVLNFASDRDYVIDGIPVITLASYKESRDEYDLLICHAPNIRNHYVFLKKYENKFEKLIFFFHGHEVLNIRKVYSKPYSFCKRNIIKTIIQEIYDKVKLTLWHFYFPKLIYKSRFIFVSKWMYDEFLKWTKINPSLVGEVSEITYNSVGEYFEKETYDYNCEKEYDFITIRSNFDGSKYAIDIVASLARNYPQYKFCIVGKGEFFKYNDKPQNIELIQRNLSHNEIIEFLNKSKCALMPTRTDAQGLMACEMATYGIPLITSNIPVCHEVFDDFNNVLFINNLGGKRIDLSKIINKTIVTKNDKYFAENTCNKELKIMKEMCNEKE